MVLSIKCQKGKWKVSLIILHCSRRCIQIAESPVCCYWWQREATNIHIWMKKKITKEMNQLSK